MPAPMLTTIAFFKMVGFSKNNEAIFHIKILLPVLTFHILIVVTYLNTTCVGLIPALKLVTGTPELVYT